MANRRILIVDDDPMIRHIVETILSTEGHEVLIAENGSQAVEILGAEPRPINLDLIISDVIMPEMTGLDLLNRLKLHADTQNIPVLMLTGESKTDDIMGGYNLGADYYITKPFTRQQLLYGVSVILK